MSRIHEALKKAEQERAAARPGAPETIVAPHAAALAPPPMLVSEHEPELPRSEALSADLLRERLSRTAWNMDPRIMIFLTGRSTESMPTLGTEEFRTLRSRLYQVRERQPLRTLLVTSALPAEGKTFVSANLAHAIVKQHDRRVLLVDADLRLSRLHHNLGAPAKPGLTDHLLGEADELSVIQRGPFENFYFIPGGRPVSNPAELLASDRFKSFIKRVGPLFDWVVLDTPPALPVADASLMADSCDGVLMVVRSAMTPFDMAQKAAQEFKPQQLVGVVLNDVEPNQGYSSYYYHYYHGGAAKNGSH